MAGHYSFAVSPGLCLFVLLALTVASACRWSSPAAPTGAPPCRCSALAAPGGAPPTCSGRVHPSSAPGTGEPLPAAVLITVRDATGGETTALSHRSGFYSDRAAMGMVVVTASKDGYE